jgi:hypothetical protein
MRDNNNVKLTCAGEFAVTLEAREAPTQEMCWQIAALCVGDTSSCHCGVITLIDVCKIREMVYYKMKF